MCGRCARPCGNPAALLLSLKQSIADLVLEEFSHPKSVLPFVKCLDALLAIHLLGSRAMLRLLGQGGEMQKKRGQKDERSHRSKFIDFSENGAKRGPSSGRRPALSSNDHKTMFTILPGTTITFLTVLPWTYWAYRSSAMAAFSISSFDRSFASSSVNRVFPLKETG